MKYYANLLLLGALTVCAPSWAQTKTICLPVDRAARQADSLRTLPIVRQAAQAQAQVVQAQRTKLQLASEESTRQQARLLALSRSIGEQEKELSTATTQAAQWRTKARRRGWIIGFGIGLPAAYGLYTLLR